MDRLMAFTSKGGRLLSPTSLTTFLECPLRFYFTYIAGIREEEAVEEEVDASGFGKLLHKTMERLYEPYKGQTVDRNRLLKIAEEANIRLCLDDAFRSEFYKFADGNSRVKPEGRNIIVYEVIRKMIGAILEYDLTRVPFTIKDLEENTQVLHHIDGCNDEIRIGGTIDRLDESGGRLHIVDYKTGKADTVFPSVEGLFDRDNWPSDKKFKGALQTFIYSWLYSKNYPGIPVQPELYVAGDIFNENFSPSLFIKEGRKPARMVHEFEIHAEEFESRLDILLTDLFDPEKPFHQTEDEKRCLYCPYAGICHRQGQAW